MATDCTDEFLSEIAGLTAFASRELEDLGGNHSCFRLQRLGKPVFKDDSVLTRARILEQCQVDLYGDRLRSFGRVEAGQVIVLRLRLSDWYSLVSHVEVFRAMWAHARSHDQVVLLDTTVGYSFLAGYIPLQVHEAIRVAEMFPGGFCGWSQAAYCLQELGVKLRSTWFLDKDPAVLETMRIANPGVKVAQGPSGFQEVDFPSEQAIMLADINEKWWHQIWALCTPDILAASPPCQPWSAAGRQGGLVTPDGALFPLLAKIAGFCQIPVVCVEEVQGFLSHPDAHAVLQEWKSAGYVLQFQQVINLADVAPTQRQRLLMIFVHQASTDLPKRFQIATWQPVSRPS